MSQEILFIGLGEVSTSIGLALKEANIIADCVGFDPDRAVARAAQKAGAVDRLVSWPAKAAKNARLVLVNLPNQEAGDFLEALAPGLPPDAIILDASPHKSATAAWARDHLGEIAYVGITPTVNPTALEDASLESGPADADLFRGGLLAIVASPSTQENAINAALGLAERIGASPFFVDPAEADAVMSAVEDLPILLSTALMCLAPRAPSWKDIQRMSGRTLASSTALCVRRPSKQTAAALTFNREHLVPRLDSFIDALGELRDALEEEKTEVVLEALEQASNARASWLSNRRKGNWGMEATTMGDFPKHGFVASLFGIDPERHKRRK